MAESTRGASGAGTFFLGLAMSVVGLYLVSRSVILHSGFAGYFFGIPFGLTLVPFLIGVGWLFYDDRSSGAWVLSGAGLLIIVAEVLASIHMALKPITLYEGVLMFGLFAGGVGLMLKAVRRARPAEGGGPG